VKTAILLKVTYRFNVTPLKLSMKLFTEIEKTILTFIWSQVNSNQKVMQEVLPIPDFKLYCRAIGTILAWYWHRTNMTNGTE
jgi:hypothetical protein